MPAANGHSPVPLFDLIPQPPAFFTTCTDTHPDAPTVTPPPSSPPYSWQPRRFPGQPLIARLPHSPDEARHDALPRSTHLIWAYPRLCPLAARTPHGAYTEAVIGRGPAAYERALRRPLAVPRDAPPFVLFCTESAHARGTRLQSSRSLASRPSMTRVGDPCRFSPASLPLPKHRVMASAAARRRGGEHS